MARHASEDNSLEVAGWIKALALLLVVALAAAALWFFTKDDDDDGARSAIGADIDAQSTTVGSTEATVSSAPAISSRTSTAPSTSSQAAQPEAQAAAADTLFLLDTSEAMSAYFGPVTAALADAATSLSAAQQQVSLWNYSSPLSPGVTVGYRQNLGFTAGGEAAEAVTRFGTGGVAQTRSAVVAAIANASDKGAETGKPTRVLLVTTGTEQDLDDASFAQQYKAAAGNNAELAVVHVGEGAQDEALKKVSKTFTTVPAGADQATVAKAVNAAAGTK